MYGLIFQHRGNKEYVYFILNIDTGNIFKLNRKMYNLLSNSGVLIHKQLDMLEEDLGLPITKESKELICNYSNYLLDNGDESIFHMSYEYFITNMKIVMKFDTFPTSWYAYNRYVDYIVNDNLLNEFRKQNTFNGWIKYCDKVKLDSIRGAIKNRIEQSIEQSIKEYNFNNPTSINTIVASRERLTKRNFEIDTGDIISITVTYFLISTATKRQVAMLIKQFSNDAFNFVFNSNFKMVKVKELNKNYYKVDKVIYRHANNTVVVKITLKDEILELKYKYEKEDTEAEKDRNFIT